MIHVDQDLQDKAARQVIQIEWNSRAAMYIGALTAGMVFGGFRRVIFNQGTILRNQGIILDGLEHISGQVIELSKESATVKQVLRLAADKVGP